MAKIKLNDFKGKAPYSMEDLSLDPQLERRHLKRERRNDVKERDLERRSKRQDKRKQFY